MNTRKNESNWSEIWQFWAKHNYKEHNNIIELGEIKTQNIWFNSSIRINDQPIYYKEWYNKGLKTLDNLRKDNKWINITDFFRDYRIKTDFLTLIAVLQTIPINWR